MIDFAMTTPIEDFEVHHFPLEIISEILQQVNNDLCLFIKKYLSYVYSKKLIYLDLSMRM
jgi:hypothetical protein